MIIISTVRVSESEDAKSSLGYVANPQRFNVAVTRARDPLIVVGQTTVLRKDTNWNALYQECKMNNCVVGDDENVTEK